jgi:ribulose-5-phosphate 4-epimerase/fuculose-1-phosphate aldolase
MIDEGYIKFQCDWTAAPPPVHPALRALMAWRDRLFDLRLIGAYPDGIGYGNVSVRDGDGCVISGSGTGGRARLEEGGYTRVTAAEIGRNRVACAGPVRASSETMSHMAIYAAVPAAGAVIHIHSLTAWERLLGRIPTTAGDVAYGTPEMAREIARLIRAGEPEPCGIIAMAGHREGIIAYGRDVEEAGGIVIARVGEVV